MYIKALLCFSVYFKLEDSDFDKNSDDNMHELICLVYRNYNHTQGGVV